jgi:GxxExxY protein
VLFLLSELNKFSELYSVLAEHLCFSQRRKGANKKNGIHMTENELSRHIVNVAFRIHKELGPGLLESVYEEIMYFELIRLNLQVDRQRAIPVIWNNLKMELGFRADLIVEQKVIIELKSIEVIAPVHCKQLLTYLKITGLKLGLLINFNEALIKEGITRIVNNL